MKIEDHFRDTLHGAVANEPPVLDAWDRFEHRMGRTRRWRLVAALTGAAAVIAVGAIVVPQLATNGAPGPRFVSTPDPYAGWLTATNEVQQWTLKHPNSWRFTHFEDIYEVLPPGEIGTIAGEPTFAVTVVRISADFELPAAAEDPTVVRGALTDGRPFMRIQQRGQSIGYIYRIDWSPPCAFATQGAICDYEPSVLIVHVYATDQARLDKYGEEGDLVAKSIEYRDVPPPTEPPRS
jgi:hypothetical protein